MRSQPLNLGSWGGGGQKEQEIQGLTKRLSTAGKVDGSEEADM